jgi:hypothetical protein
MQSQDNQTDFTIMRREDMIGIAVYLLICAALLTIVATFVL